MEKALQAATYNRTNTVHHPQAVGENQTPAYRLYAATYSFVKILHSACESLGALGFESGK